MTQNQFNFRPAEVMVFGGCDCQIENDSLLYREK